MDKLAVVNTARQFQSPFTNYGGKGINDAVSLGINVAFIAAGLFVLGFVAVAGFQIIKGAGSGNSQSTEKAKQAVTSAFIGFVIIFTAYWIIQIIEAITQQNFITAPI